MGFPKPYQGPIAPGTSEKTFRKTGRSVSSGGSYQGPVQPGISEEIFRETGVSVPEKTSPAKEWSGKVEQIGEEGEVVQTGYIVEGKSVGGIKGGYAYIPPTVGGASLAFGEKEKVIIGKEGITQYLPSPYIEVGGMGYSVAPDLQEEFKRGLLISPRGTALPGVPGFEKEPEFRPELLTVEAAPTFWEQYSGFIEDKPKISGTLEFAGEKVKGYLSTRYDLFGGKYGGRQESIGKLGQVTTHVAPFFVPVLGPSLALGIGAETILTTTGREEVFLTSKEWEKQYGLPTTVGTVGQFGFAGGLVAFGGKGLVTDIEKVSGLPKTTTGVLGVQQEVGEKKLITDVLFETKTKKLLGTTTDIGVAKVSTDILRAEELIGARSITLGAFGTKGIKLPSGTIKLGRIKQFSVSEWGLAQPSKVTETFKSGIFKVSKEAEGFKTIFGGRVAVGKDLIAKPLKIKKIQFLGGGGGFNIGRMSRFFGKTRIVKEGALLKIGDVGRSLQRQGQGVFEGLILKKQPKTKMFDILGGRKLNTMLTQQAIKGAVGADVAVALSRTYKTARPIAIPKFDGKPIVTTQLPEMKTKVTTESISLPKLKDVQKEMAKLATGISTGLSTKIRTITKTRARTQQREELGLSTGLIQTPIPKQAERQKTISRQLFKGLQQQRQKQRTITRDFFTFRGFPKPLAPSGFPPLLPLLPPAFGETKKKIPKYKRRLKRTPSWGAVELGMFAPKALRGEFTGLIERPRIRKITKRKKK